MGVLGLCPSFSKVRIWCVASLPSIFGIEISINTKSGENFSNNAIASSPLAANFNLTSKDFNIFLKIN